MKKVFIGVLAALMLFAFTACENQVPVYRTVDYITLSQNQDVIKDQPFTADMVNINIYYTDGSVESRSAKGYISDVATTSKEFAVKVTDFAGTESASLIINPVDPVSATVTATAQNRAVVTDTSDMNAGPVTLASYTVTLTSENGSYTFTDKDNVTAYQVTADDLTADQKKTIGTYTVGLNVAYGSTEIPTESTVDVQVYDGSEPQPDTTPADIVATVTSADDYYGTSATVTINYVNAAGEKLSTVNSTDYYVMDSTGKIVSDPFTGLKLGTAPVTYTIRTTGTNYMECEATIPAGLNYITNTIDEVAVVVADGEKVWTEGSPVSVSDFKLSEDIKYAIEGNTTTDDYIRFTVSEAGSDFRLSKGSNTIHYQLQYSIKGADEKESDVKTLTINVQ